MSGMKNFYQSLISGLANYALNTVASVNILGQAKEHAVYVAWGSATTAGQVVVEEAPHKDFAGDWINLATFDWAAAVGTSGRCDVWSGTRAMGAVRTRITTAIAGGEGSPQGGVTTTYVGNP